MLGYIPPRPKADPPVPKADTPLWQTATAADGMHPTGMHSCLNKKFSILFQLNGRFLSYFNILH